METVTDIAVQDCFVIHVLDNRLPAVQCSQALTPLPDTLRASLHRYLLALLKPQFRRKRYGRFRPESVVLQAYQQMRAVGPAWAGRSDRFPRRFSGYCHTSF